MIMTASIFEVQEGQELAEDLIIDDCKLLSKGRKLTPQIIKILKSRKITTLPIQLYTEDEEEPVLEEPNIEEMEVNLNYLDSLSSLNIETRYGLAAQDEEFLTHIFEIYNKLESSPVVHQLLLNLKNYDTYTFLHSLDVFTLGTLYARHLNLPMLETIALGYLLHDVGKVTIPHEVLNKPGKLTRLEYDIVKNHPLEGERMLQEFGLEDAAYFSCLHHERNDGSGYPFGIKGTALPIEIEILQLVDTYSAITLRRAYRLDKHSADAMTIMCKDRHLFNRELLYNFINFVGIYPEGAMVLLSNGQPAHIDRTTPSHPLLPQVRCMTTGESFMMPTDFQVKVQDLLSFEPETKEQTYNKLFEYLMNGDEERLEKYYNEFSEHYQPHELFIKVVIPIYQSLSILKAQSLITNICYNNAVQKLHKQIRKTNHELSSINQRHRTFLVMLPHDTINTLAVQIFEGLLHADGIYPLLVETATNEIHMQSIEETCNVDGVIIVGDDTIVAVEKTSNKITYDLTIQHLEHFVGRFSGMSPHQFDALKGLARYKREQIATYLA